MAISPQLLQAAQMFVQTLQNQQKLAMEREQFLAQVEYQDRMYQLRADELDLQERKLNLTKEVGDLETRLKAAQATKAEQDVITNTAEQIEKDSIKRLPTEAGNRPFAAWGSMKDLQKTYSDLLGIEQQNAFMDPETRKKHEGQKRAVLDELGLRTRAYDEELRARPSSSDDPAYDKAVQYLKQNQLVLSKTTMPGATEGLPVAGVTAAPGARETTPAAPAGAAPAVQNMFMDWEKNPEVFRTDLARSFAAARAAGASPEQIRQKAMEIAHSANATGKPPAQFQEDVMSSFFEVTGR